MSDQMRCKLSSFSNTTKSKLTKSKKLDMRNKFFYKEDGETLEQVAQ